VRSCDLRGVLEAEEMIGKDSLKRLKDAGKVNWTSWREAIERELDYISKT